MHRVLGTNAVATHLPVVRGIHADRSAARRARWAKVLGAIGAPADAIDREMAAMKEAAICRTASRRVLGTMTELALMMAAYRNQDPGRVDDSLVAMSAWLAGTPCSPIAMGFPREVVVAALGGADLPSLA